MFALGKRLEAEQGPADAAHLNKIRRWSALCGAVGVATMAVPGPAALLGVNPVAVAALSLWSFSRWTMIAHHTCHGGYNRLAVPAVGVGSGERFKAATFGVGGARARARDWLDWMLPEVKTPSDSVSGGCSCGFGLKCCPRGPRGFSWRIYGCSGALRL